MNNNRMPQFDTMAETDITSFDLDNIIDSESGSNNRSVQNSNNHTANNNSSIVNTNTNNIPSTVSSNTGVTQISTKDTVNQSLQEVLDSDVNDADYSQNVAPISNGTSNTVVDNNSNSNNNDSVNQTDAYVVAFDILKDLDMLRIPEGFNLDKIDVNTLIAMRDNTLDMQRQEAYEYMCNEVAHDPYMLDLLDYSYEGGTFANLPRMVNILQQDLDHRTIDLNDEKNQKEMVKRYYSDGLNPNNEKDAKLISFIPSRIDVLIKDKKLRDEAEIARTHFLKKAEASKKAEYDRVIKEQEQERQRIIEEQKELEKWDKAFRDALSVRNWTEDRKEAVRKENALVRLKDGNAIPMWEYKMTRISNDPKLFQMFLDFTSKFDPKSNSFIDNKDETVPASAINALVDRLNRKSQDTASYANTNGVRNNQNNQQSNTRTIDPTKEIW